VLSIDDQPALDLDRYRERIDAALDHYATFDGGCPANLSDAIRYALLGPGKRLRPHLVLTGAEACGGSIETALPAACAVEMVHAYSLVHDDLPAMDDDDLRRGRPTCHKVFGEATAILAGDALLARAFDVMAREIDPPAVAAKCCEVLAQAAGASALVGGQAADLAVSQDATAAAGANLSELEAIHNRKTGALFVASLELGGLVSQASPEQLAALAAYGRRVGLAFQITDDLLDAAGSQSAVGKRVAKDSAQGKLTYPALLGMEASRLRAAKLLDDACGMIELFGQRGQQLRNLARFVLLRTH
jgi:geranylgeranyl diphosphate synthase, type II